MGHVRGPSAVSWTVDGAKVRARATDLEISLMELSRRSHISYAHIKNIVNNAFRPRDYTVRKLARGLDCRIEDIAAPRPAPDASGAAA